MTITYQNLTLTAVSENGNIVTQASVDSVEAAKVLITLFETQPKVSKVNVRNENNDLVVLTSK